MPEAPDADTSAALSIRNLRVDYGPFTAVNDLDLDLAPGEIFGLAGPNGAGKTSTIRAIATLLEPTYGDITICGHDLYEEPASIHALIGYMPDLAPVVPDLKIHEFLELYAASHGLGPDERRARVDACLAAVRLADKRELFGRELSRGMMQRVVLAKTLLHEPKLLLLDEPASGMDPIARRDLRLILEDLAAGGATVLVSSHILSELAEMCTSVGIMHLGRLVRHGPIRHVVEAGNAERTEIEVTVVGSVDIAISWLHARSDVSTIEADGNSIAFVFAGSERGRAGLLRDMLGDDIAVSGFSPGRSGIESMLMGLVESER